MERSEADSGRDIQRGGEKVSLFYNNYQRLVQENNDAIAEISAESWRTLNNMFEYMIFYNISLFELEVIKKDLIGAAREADMEGIDFKEKLGMPEKEFCDSLVREEMEHIWQERLILAVRNAVMVFFGFYTFLWLMDGVPANYGISVTVLFIGVWCIAWNYIVTYRIRGLGAYRLSDRGKRWFSLGGFIALMTAYTSILIYISAKRIFFVKGNGAVIFLILFILSAAVFFGNNIYWDRRSKRYNWR